VSEAKELPFVLLAGVNTVAATPADISKQNIPVNIARGHTRLHMLPEFQKVKGENVPIALVGGGPSIKDTIDEVRSFRHVIACGSSHDYLVESGIVPEYCAICDPDPIMANYLRKPQTETKYLVASSSDASVFDALAGMQIVLWHCAPVDKEFMDEVDPGWHMVGGGCTVGLRAISISIVLGYTNIHFFGFDSCLGEDGSHHAYSFTDESESLGDIFCVKIGSSMSGPDEDSNMFRCAGYQLAQADHFKKFVEMYGKIFTPTFHGTGLLPALWSDIKAKAEAMTATEVHEELQ